MSSESLMSLREHRLLFRVLPVPASVRPPGNNTARVYFTVQSGSVYFNVSSQRHWPDFGPFPVEVPQTLVLGESRLFLSSAELGAGLDGSCLSSKEETIHSLLSSRSVYWRNKHTHLPFTKAFTADLCHTHGLVLLPWAPAPHPFSLVRCWRPLLVSWQLCLQTALFSWPGHWFCSLQFTKYINGIHRWR